MPAVSMTRPKKGWISGIPNDPIIFAKGIFYLLIFFEGGGGGIIIFQDVFFSLRVYFLNTVLIEKN